MTEKEIKEIERVFQKPILEVDEWDIPPYIIKRDEEERQQKGGEIEEII